jgi:hypothetical protein
MVSSVSVSLTSSNFDHSIRYSRMNYLHR